MKKNKKGFTLIELLAVIVILGIILTIVVSNVVKYIGQARTGSYVDAYQIILKGLRTELLANEMNNGKAELTTCDDTVASGTKCSTTYSGLYEAKNISLTIDGNASSGYKIKVTPTANGSFKGVDLEKTETDNTTISKKDSDSNTKYTILNSIISSDGTVSAPTSGINHTKPTTSSASK